MQEPGSTTGSVILDYEIVGQGSPLVLLAGFASDRQTWAFQREALSKRHRVVLIDNRGAGRSPAPPGPYTTREMAQDVLDVFDRAGIATATVLGHSLGGAIAQELALLRPGAVERMILVSTFVHGQALPLTALAKWRRGLLHGVDERLMIEEVLPLVYTPSFLDHPHRARSIVGFLRAHRYPPTEQGLDGQFAAIESHDSRARLPQIACPTLVLVGELDRLTSPAMSRDLAERIPGARYQELAGAAHVCMIEQPEALCRAILDFVL
jgi:pimeloyl-ACP methyl ester carboxylesterase